MARILIEDKWFEQVEPSTFSESELEDNIVLHAPSVYPDYYVMPFKLTVEATSGKARPDLVFVSKEYDEWWVVEVEMGYHDFNSHVEPQIRVLSDAIYGKHEAEYVFGKNSHLDLLKTISLFENIPPQILLIVNQPKPEWVKPLKKYNAIIAVLELFRADDELEIFRVNGEYPVLLVDNISDCSFHPFVKRLLKIHNPDKLSLPPRAKLKVRFNNCITEWSRVDAEGAVWLQPVSRSPLNPDHQYEIFQQRDLSLVLRVRVS